MLKAPLASGTGGSCCFLLALPLAGLPLSSNRSGERGVDLPLPMSLPLLGCRCGDLQRQRAEKLVLFCSYQYLPLPVGAVPPSLLAWDQMVNAGFDLSWSVHTSPKHSDAGHQTTHPHTAPRRAWTADGLTSYLACRPACSAASCSCTPAFAGLPDSNCRLAAEPGHEPARLLAPEAAAACKHGCGFDLPVQALEEEV